MISIIEINHLYVFNSYSHVGENAEIAIIKNAGHAVNLEKPKEFAKHLKSFLTADSLSTSSSSSSSSSSFPQTCRDQSHENKLGSSFDLK